MTSIKLTSSFTPDLLDGDIQFVDGVDELRQDVVLSLHVWQGEWFRDRSAGFNHQRVLGRSDQLTRDAEIKRVVLAVPGVLAIGPESYRTKFDSVTRVIDIAFDLKTIHGDVTIDQTFNAVNPPFVPDVPTVPGANQPPVVAFVIYVDPTNPMMVHGEASANDDGSISSIVWDWGDGSTTVGAISSHEYPSTGTYGVFPTATDNELASTSGTPKNFVATAIAPIPEPDTGLVYDNIIRAFDLGDGLKSVIPNTGTLSDFTAAGVARPTITSGVLAFDGVANEIQQATAVESNWITDGGDWVIQLIFQASSVFATGTHRLFATYDNTTGIYFQVASGTLRIYGFGTGSDNSAFGGIVWDDSFVCLTMVFDSSGKDIFKYVNNKLVKDSNWAMTPIVADQDHPLTIGSGVGGDFSALKLKDFRTAPITYSNYDYAKYAMPYYAWAVKYEHI